MHALDARPRFAISLWRPWSWLQRLTLYRVLRTCNPAMQLRGAAGTGLAVLTGRPGVSLDTAIRESATPPSRTSYTSSVPLFSRSKNPPWLDAAREFCRARNITIMGWGPRALMVEAKSQQRAEEISAQLANLGFQPVPDPDDDYAGILTLSHPE